MSCTWEMFFLPQLKLVFKLVLSNAIFFIIVIFSRNSSADQPVFLFKKVIFSDFQKVNDSLRKTCKIILSLKHVPFPDISKTGRRLSMLSWHFFRVGFSPEKWLDDYQVYLGNTCDTFSVFVNFYPLRRGFGSKSPLREFKA